MIHPNFRLVWVLSMLLLFFVASAPLRASSDLSGGKETEAFQIGIEAYLYFYPLVMMDVTRQVSTNVPPGGNDGRGPANMVHHFREFPSAEFRGVVRPNFDTLYSSAWIDLSEEPVVVSAPDTDGRYYLLPFLDMWTDVLAVPGSRTSGTQEQHWALVPRGWSGDLPDGVEAIEATTDTIAMLGRIQTNGPDDYEFVNTIQDGILVTPLSQFGKGKVKPAAFVVNPDIDMETPPLIQVDRMEAAEFFGMAAELLKRYPPHSTDWSQIQRLARIGIVPGESFDLEKASPEVKEALERVIPAAQKLMQTGAAAIGRIANGWNMWTDTVGVYGNFYLKRAVLSRVGLGANPPEDAIYPMALFDAEMQPIVGSENYVLHFTKEELPPVDAFWSLTMYDEQGFQVANALNRFAIGDRDDLAFNEDGSLTLYIQHESPGKDKESNWLPAPATGPLGLTMRLYAPDLRALDGRWNPPAIKKTDS